MTESAFPTARSSLWRSPYRDNGDISARIFAIPPRILGGIFHWKEKIWQIGKPIVTSGRIRCLVIRTITVVNAHMISIAPEAQTRADEVIRPYISNLFNIVQISKSKETAGFPAVSSTSLISYLLSFIFAKLKENAPAFPSASQHRWASPDVHPSPLRGTSFCPLQTRSPRRRLSGYACRAAAGP